MRYRVLYFDKNEQELRDRIIESKKLSIANEGAVVFHNGWDEKGMCYKVVEVIANHAYEIIQLVTDGKK